MDHHKAYTVSCIISIKVTFLKISRSLRRNANGRVTSAHCALRSGALSSQLSGAHMDVAPLPHLPVAVPGDCAVTSVLCGNFELACLSHVEHDRHECYDHL